MGTSGKSREVNCKCNFRKKKRESKNMRKELYRGGEGRTLTHRLNFGWKKGKQEAMPKEGKGASHGTDSLFLNQVGGLSEKGDDTFQRC